MDKFDIIDKEFDDMSGDDFDIGADDGDEREPDLSLLQRIKVGAKSSIKEIDAKTLLRDSLKETIPELIGNEADSAISGAVSGMKEALTGAKADIRDSTEGIFEFINGRTKEGSVMDKAVKKVQGFLKDEEKLGSNGPSEMDKANEEIRGLFGSNQLALSNLELLKQTASSTASADKSKVSIASAQLEMTKYKTALQERYYKKSIELKYRHLIETKRGNLVHEEKNNLILEALAAISKNTGLPDAVKIKSSEVFKHQAKQTISRSLYDFIGVNKRFSDVVGKNIKNKVSDIKNSVVGALTMGDTMAGVANSTSGMIDEDMLDMMSPEERAEFSKSGQLAGMATGGMIRNVKDRVLDSAKRKIAESEIGSKAINSINKIMSDPSRYLDDKKASTKSPFWSKLFGFAGDLARDTDTKSGATLRTTSANLDDVAHFDMRTYNSVNSHIPGLLSKILREVTVISTGDPSVKELQFDNVRGEFSTAKSVKGMLKKELANRHGAGTKSSIYSGIKAMEKQAGISLSPEERELFASELLNNESNLNTDYVVEDVKDGLFSNLDNITSMKFTSLIKGAGDYKTIDENGKDVVDNTRSIDTNYNLSSIHRHNVDMTSRLENLVKDGYGDALVEEGLMTFNPATNEYKVIPSAIRALNADVILSSMEDTDETTIKAEAREMVDDGVNLNMEAMKNKISDTFHLADKKTIISAVKDMSKKMKSVDREEILSFVETNYEKANEAFDNVEDTILGIKKGTKSYAKNVKEKYKIDVNGIRNGSWKDMFNAKKLKETVDDSVNLNVEAVKNKISDTFHLADKKTIISAVKDMSKKMKPTDREEILSFVETNHKKANEAFDKVEDTILEIKKGAKSYAKNVKEKSKIDSVNLNMEAMKDEISGIFHLADKKTIISAVKDMSKKMKSTDKEEILSFVETNHKKANEAFDKVEDTILEIKKGTKTYAKNVKEKYKIDAVKALDTKHRGKNFFDKMSDSLVSALNRSKKKASSTFDKDGDGIRDGSWREIFNAKKLKDKTTGLMSGKLKPDKEPKGISGLLMGMVPLLGTVLGSVMKKVMSPFSALIDGVKYLRNLPLISKLIPAVAGIIGGGLNGVGRTIARAAELIMGTIRVTSITPGGGFRGKLRNVGRFFNRNKGKMAIGAGLLALFGATKIHGDDTLGDTASNLGDDPLGFDSILNSMTGGSIEGATQEDEVMKIDPVTGLMVGSMVAPTIYGAGKKIKDKVAKMVDVKKNLKGSKQALQKASKAAEVSMINAGSKMKLAQKAGGKALTKVIPGLNVVAGAMNVYDDIEKGDYRKAALHTLTTALNFIPFVGMPLSMVGDYMIDSYGEAKDRAEKVSDYYDHKYGDKNRTSRMGGGHTGRSKPKVVAEQKKKDVIHGISKTPSKATKAKFDPKSKPSAGDKILLEKISQHESAKGKAGYEMVYSGYKKKLPKPLTTMTLDEIARLQTDMDASSNSTAVGKYQFVAAPLVEVRVQMKLSMYTIFSPHIQDEMVLYRLNSKRRYADWKAGAIGDDDFIENLSKEFSSLPSISNGGRSYYDKINGNRSLTTIEEMRAVLSKVREALGMPVAEPSEVVEGAKNTSADGDSSDSSTLIGGLEMALKAVMKFFGSTAMGKMIDGDSSTNKPRLSRDSSSSATYRQADTAKSAKPAKICGIDIIKLPAIPRAISMGGNRRFAGGAPRNLVIHNTAGTSLNFGRMKTTGFGTQFWIDRDGKIYQVGEVDQVLAHVGPVKNKKAGVFSKNSLGIEMVCMYKKKTKQWDAYTAPQAESLQKLSACIRATFNIPPERIYFHEQISPKTKDEGKEGAIIAKTGQLLETDESGSTVENSYTIAEDPASPAVSVSGIVADAVSTPMVDGDSSTNRPELSTTSTHARAMPLAQEDATVSMVNKFSEGATEYFISMDDSLKSMLEVSRGIMEVNRSILETITGKMSNESREHTKVKQISLDMKPAINLKS